MSLSLQVHLYDSVLGFHSWSDPVAISPSFHLLLTPLQWAEPCSYQGHQWSCTPNRHDLPFITFLLHLHRVCRNAALCSAVPFHFSGAYSQISQPLPAVKWSWVVESGEWYVPLLGFSTSTYRTHDSPCVCSLFAEGPVEDWKTVGNGKTI